MSSAFRRPSWVRHSICPPFSSGSSRSLRRSAFPFSPSPLGFRRSTRSEASGAVIGGTATTAAEAAALEEAGVDFVVAQGSEAGGHRGTFLHSFEEALVGGLALFRRSSTA